MTYIPPSRDLEENWRQLKHMVHNTIPDERERNAYLAMLNQLAGDVTEGFVTLLGFKRAPAAKGNHHAFEGGLVYHLLEMWQCWEMIRERAIFKQWVSDERVAKAILLHDLHKAYRTFKLVSALPWEVDYANDVTDMLLTNDIKTLWLAMAHHLPLDPEQLNALIQAEGGYSPIKPRWTSVLAKVCYLLDEMSGNVINRIDSKTLLNIRVPLKPHEIDYEFVTKEAE